MSEAQAVVMVSPWVRRLTRFTVRIEDPISLGWVSELSVAPDWEVAHI